MSLTQVAQKETTLEAGGHAKGVAVAIVRQNRDDSGQGRVKVSYPWHETPRESYWARVTAPMAGKSRGIYFMPEVNDEVLVAFDRGDLRFPYVIGALWNGVDQSPLNNADGKNDVRVIHSRSDHTFTISDASGDPMLELKLADGKFLKINKDGIEINDAQGSKVAIKSGTITVEAVTKVEISAPQISVKGSGTVNVEAGGALTLKGAVVNIN